MHPTSQMTQPMRRLIILGLPKTSSEIDCPDTLTFAISPRSPTALLSYKLHKLITYLQKRMQFSSNFRWLQQSPVVRNLFYSNYLPYSNKQIFCLKHTNLVAWGNCEFVGQVSASTSKSGGLLLPIIRSLCLVNHTCLVQAGSVWSHESAAIYNAHRGALSLLCKFRRNLSPLNELPLYSFECILSGQNNSRSLWAVFLSYYTAERANVIHEQQL